MVALCVAHGRYHVFNTDIMVMQYVFQDIGCCMKPTTSTLHKKSPQTRTLRLDMSPPTPHMAIVDTNKLLHHSCASHYKNCNWQRGLSTIRQLVACAP